MATFPRITVDARQMGGLPCVRGLRIPVATIRAMVAGGLNKKEILAAYPDLQAEDITEALKYARLRGRRQAPANGPYLV